MKCFSASITAVLMAVSVASSAQPFAAAKLAAVAPVAAVHVVSAPATVPQAPAAVTQAPAAMTKRTVRGAVLSGNTLYVSGQLDLDDQGQPGKTPQESARLALDNVKSVVEDAGFSMSDLVLVQVFSTDLKSFDAFNKVYRTYFSGPPPARAFMGAGSLLRGGHFEVLGIAVKDHK